jgi:AcrR family transcriptional regulator
VPSQTIVVTAIVYAPARRAAHSASSATPQMVLNTRSSRRNRAEVADRRSHAAVRPGFPLVMNGLSPADMSGRRSATEARIAIALLTSESLAIMTRGSPVRKLTTMPATRLFVARGFDEVTISQVADAAEVAKMTVTNYFPRKEDLVFDRAEAVTGHLAGVAAARAPGESLLTAVRRDYAGAVARADVTLGLSSPAFARMVASSPVLATREREMLLLRERALGDAMAAETGADGPQLRLAAALLASVHRAGPQREPAARGRPAGHSRLS